MRELFLTGGREREEGERPTYKGREEGRRPTSKGDGREGKEKRLDGKGGEGNPPPKSLAGGDLPL